MAVEGQNLYVTQGDDEKVKVIIDNSQDNLKPLNLDGVEVIWELYAEPFHKLVLSKSSKTEGITISSPSEGIAYITVSEADTLGLKVGGQYSHRVRIVDTFGQKTTVSKGDVIVKN